MATPPTFSAGAVLTAAQMNKIGLWTTVPTSVANGTISGNAVTFSGVSSVSLNGVFTSDFDAYRIVASMYGSAFSYATLRWRASGTDDTSLS